MTPDEYLMWGRLVDRLACHHLIRHNAIPWAAPVPYFGNPDTALVATVSRQLSHGEFLDRSANELRGPRRRFHTLRSLGLRSWPDLRAEHSDRMAALCRAYFARNPLRQWLNRLAPALAATGCSYRDGAACHLSLLPYALSPNRNRALPDQEMQRLLSECGGPALAHVVRDAPIRLLILNGSAVVSWLRATGRNRPRRNRAHRLDSPRRLRTPPPRLRLPGFGGAHRRRCPATPGAGNRLQPQPTQPLYGRPRARRHRPMGRRNGPTGSN